MKKSLIKKYTLAVSLIALATTLQAKEKKVNLDAHEHGVAEINIVWEGKELNIELLSPAFNITGFESKPKNHEQEEKIEIIENALNLPNELFSFKGAQCKLVKADIESPFEEHADHDKHESKKEHDEHEHEEHEHEEHAKHVEYKEHDKHDNHDEHKKDDKHAEHDHNEHKDHDDHAEHKDHEASTHSEYEINYEFNCANSNSELTIATAKLFSYLPQMEKIKVQWLSATQQSSSVITKKNSIITLN